MTTSPSSVNYVLAIQEWISITMWGDPYLLVYSGCSLRRTTGGYATCILAQLSAPLCWTPPIHTCYKGIIYPNHVLAMLVGESTTLSQLFTLIAVSSSLHRLICFFFLPSVFTIDLLTTQHQQSISSQFVLDRK
jgi:hypothetical protein